MRSISNFRPPFCPYRVGHTNSKIIKTATFLASVFDGFSNLEIDKRHKQDRQVKVSSRFLEFGIEIWPSAACFPSKGCNAFHKDCIHSDSVAFFDSCFTGTFEY